jgi:hypothetical protein
MITSPTARVLALVVVIVGVLASTPHLFGHSTTVVDKGLICNGSSRYFLKPLTPPQGFTHSNCCSRHHIIGRAALVPFWNKVVEAGAFDDILRPHCERLADVYFNTQDMDRYVRAADVDSCSPDQMKALLDVVGQKENVPGDGSSCRYTLAALFMWQPGM